MARRATLTTSFGSPSPRLAGSGRGGLAHPVLSRGVFGEERLATSLAVPSGGTAAAIVMSVPFEDDPVYLTELPDDLRARRAAAARRRRWRRRLVALAVLAVLGGIAAVAVVSLAGGEGAGTKAADSQGGQAHAGSGPGGTNASYPADLKPYTGPVPIIEYHAIQPPVASSDYPQLFVPQDDFVEQMKWLPEHGYEGGALHP